MRKEVSQLVTDGSSADLPILTLTDMNDIRVHLDIDAIITICKKYRIGELSLFGSVLRKDFDYDNSDIDILVEFLPDTPVRSLLDQIKLKFVFSDMLGRDVDLVEKRALSPYIKDSVLMSKRVVYVGA
ncbi:MAG: nucleotidyltransferase domain-containing protein [Peptococcaceae bacterium]|nr:nucleotidyltransferase domain-containing protein [Peptococcaceae bacterium]